MCRVYIRRLRLRVVVCRITVIIVRRHTAGEVHHVVAAVDEVVVRGRRGSERGGVAVHGRHTVLMRHTHGIRWNRQRRQRHTRDTSGRVCVAGRRGVSRCPRDRDTLLVLLLLLLCVVRRGVVEEVRHRGRHSRRCHGVMSTRRCHGRGSGRRRCFLRSDVVDIVVVSGVKEVRMRRWDVHLQTGERTRRC